MQYVHHLLVHSCDTLDEVDLTQGGPCGSVNRAVAACRIGPVVAAWAVGGQVSYIKFIVQTIRKFSQEFILPENVALPIGGPGADRYFVIEMHYNNPGRLSGNFHAGNNIRDDNCNSHTCRYP